MKDLTNIKIIQFKGALFLLLGGIAAALLMQRHWNLMDTALLVIAIWGFCRAYYFAFYVIEHYVDPSFRFAGLGAFCRYVIGRKKGGR